MRSLIVSFGDELFTLCSIWCRHAGNLAFIIMSLKNNDIFTSACFSQICWQSKEIIFSYIFSFSFVFFNPYAIKYQNCPYINLLFSNLIQFSSLLRTSVQRPVLTALHCAAEATDSSTSSSVKMMTIRVPESWKRSFLALTSYRRAPEEPLKQTNSVSTVHSTPAGQYPTEGPQPQKLPVLFYYLSVCLSIVGVFTLAKCSFVHVGLFVLSLFCKFWVL